VPLALDASSCVAQVGNAVTTVTSPAFSPPADSTLFMLLSVNSGATGMAVTGVADSAGLTWTRLARDNPVVSGGSQTTEVWWAYTAPARAGMTVTATFAPATNASYGPPMGLMRMLVFTGATSVQNGAVAVRNLGTAGAASLSLTTSADGSWVWGAVANWNSSTAPTPGAGQAVDQFAANTTGWGTGFWTQNQTAHTTNSGTSVTINATAPTNDVFTMVAFEVTSIGAAWSVAVRGVPPGGIAGQHLTKLSAANYDVGWAT
jgi:hypothetical protein